MILIDHYHTHLSEKRVLVTMKDKLYLDIGRMATSLGRDVCNSLLLAHAISGCDVTSYLYNIGELTVAKVVLSHPRLLTNILNHAKLTPDHRSRLETFV